MSKFKLFAWKNIQGILPTRGKLRHIGMDTEMIAPFVIKKSKPKSHFL